MYNFFFNNLMFIYFSYFFTLLKWDTKCFYIAGGVVIWTLLEYILHRWLFHLTPKKGGRIWRTTHHFLLHGLHHKVS